MSDVRDTEPRLLKEPRGGVPDVTSTLDGYHRVCDAMAEATGSLAADAERASGFRYGHEDWLIQFKREGAGIALLDPVALTRAGADWNEFNDAVGDATWILHDSLMDLPGFAEIGLKPKALFDTEIAARLPAPLWSGRRHRTLPRHHASQRAFRRRLVLPSAAARLAQLCGARRGGAYRT